MKKLVEIQNIRKNFELSRGIFRAVDDISLDIYEGETLGLVGESGSGKSTLGKLVTRILNPSLGRVLYRGRDINSINQKEFSNTFQMIFQDPYASLNPRMKVADIVAEGLDINTPFLKAKFDKSYIKERRERVLSLLNRVGLNEEHANRYPHEFSGGQRQRIGIARALAIDPKFIVCDEPISALDVSIQAQVVNLLKRLQKEHKLTYLFISHDLAMVRYISDRIAVMYKGKIVEVGKSDDIIFNPLHPYTQSLIDSIPAIERGSFSKRTDKDIDYYSNLKEITPGHFAAI